MHTPATTVHVYLAAAFLLLPASLGVSAETCDTKFQVITNHTACLSASPSLISSGTVDTDMIQEIVNRHNYHRSNVNPTATNMLKMSWDEEVALIAQAWADNCDIAHDDNYARMIPGRYNAGQNLAMMSLTSTNWTVIIDLWHDEVNSFLYGSGSTDGSAVGHYTQIVWAESHKIGCGYSSCSISGFVNFYVCNYSPAGNSFSSQNFPYKNGTSCGDCPSTCSDNLCDCSTQQCYNGGTLDVNTCACACRNSASYYVGAECALNCTGIGTPYCGFSESQCSIYSNVPFDCPVTCGFCQDTIGTTDVSSSGTTTLPTSPTTGLEYMCYPNGTIEIVNPDSATYPYITAVQNEGVSSAIACSVSNNGSVVVLSGCSKDENITVSFSDKGVDDVFYGQELQTFVISCRELSASGVTRIVDNPLVVALSTKPEDTITPSFLVTSAVRSSSATGNTVSVVSVGDVLYWTIDIPLDYNGRPTCTAYSGTTSDGSPSNDLITDGCSTDSNRVGNFDGEVTVAALTKRIWTTLYAFKFFNSDAVYFACTVKVCPSTSNACDLSCGRRKRDIRNLTAEETSMIFTTGDQLRVTERGRQNGHASTLGSAFLMLSAVMTEVFLAS